MNFLSVYSGVLLLSAVVLRGAEARVFYVDGTNGSDSADGLTAQKAWRSLAKVNRTALVPGDRVLFQRGQSWRGQLVPQSGATNGVITYGAYGEGAKPVLLGSVAAERNEDWEPAGHGLWVTAPLRFDPLGVAAKLSREGWTLHQEAGASFKLGQEKGEGGELVLRLECRNPGTKANHAQLSFPGLKVEEDAYYLLAVRARATQPVRLSSVSLMKAGPPWTSYASVDLATPAVGTNWERHIIRFRGRQTAEDGRLTFFLGGALPAGATLFLCPEQLTKARCSQPIPLSVDVGNIIFDHGASTGVKKWSEAELRREGDYFYDARNWQVKLRCDGHPASRYRSIELGLNRHIINQGGRGYVTYENLDLRYGAAHGIGGGSTHHITVRGCDISFIGGGHQMTRPDGKPVRFGNGIEFWSSARDCLVEDCRLWEIYDAALTNQGDGTNVQENITYRRNVIWNSEYSFEYWNRGTSSRTRNILFEHNTCVDAGHGWGYTQRPDPNGRHLMFYDNSASTTNVVIRRNIFCNAKDSLLRLHGRDWTAALSMDFNCWFQPVGSWTLWGKENFGREGFAPFLRARGFDGNSTMGDPKFVDVARRDYRVTADSPARFGETRQAAGALP